MATHEASSLDPGLAELIAMYRQLSAISSTVFAPLARTYVGRVEEHVKNPTDADVVNLALRKLAFEAGEMFVANNPPTDKEVPEFAVDESGLAPDLKLSYVAAAALAYMKSRDQKKAAAQQQQQQQASQVEVLGNVSSVRALRNSARAMTYSAAATPQAVTVRSTGGCGCGGTKVSTSSGGCGCGGKTTTTSGGCGCGGGCGGTSTTPPVAQPCYDPCAGGLSRVPPANEVCGCACGCCTPPTTDCPPFCSISCETQQKLKKCVKVLICDLFAVVENALCTVNPATGKPSALSPLFCNFLHCVREALCPTTETQPCLPPAQVCLPCSYAVEMPQ